VEGKDIAVPDSESAASDYCDAPFEVLRMNLFRADDLVKN
jgi:hypothetical protein